MLLDVSASLADIFLLDLQVNEMVIKSRNNIFGMILLIIMKSTQTLKKYHQNALAAYLSTHPRRNKKTLEYDRIPVQN